MERPSKLIGKIILADFLEYPLEKFINFVQAVEALPLYKRLTREGIIIHKPLLGAKILSEKESAFALAEVGVIAKIKKGVNFPIHYIKEEFSIEYIPDNEKLKRIINNANPVRCLLSNGVKLMEEEKKNIGRLLHKLRRISSRNLITHRILKGIVEYQRNYFEANSEIENELDLKLRPLQKVELARILSTCKENDHCRGFVIDTSRISRVAQGISIITPQGKQVSLNSLFPSRRDTVKRCIKAILRREKGDICNGLVKKPYTDEELRCKLKGEYNLSITGREVAYCRKDLGILPSSERANSYGYVLLQPNLSKIYPFTSSSVKDNAPAYPGIYELRLDGEAIEYPDGCCQTFYIGSAKNLKKRLLSHLSPNSKNGGIKRFVKEKNCVFRYLQVRRGWVREEKNLYNLFITTFGNSPVCNYVSPKTSGGDNL
ncbi:MAG: GIY-YIG nuclease family protein [Candidatus Aerophobetes bacterium]|nr:GIY-YIG nuclease family protein [Candidatus Aerophobetes bacterium]